MTMQSPLKIENSGFSGRALPRGSFNNRVTMRDEKDNDFHAIFVRYALSIRPV